VLIEKGKGDLGNPWGVSHASTLFDMTRDSGFFSSVRDMEARGLVLKGNVWRSSASRNAEYLPLFEAKMLHIFDHRWSSAKSTDDENVNESTQIKAKPSHEPVPRFWVSESEVRNRLQKQGWAKDWLIGMRKIARATDERTIIPTIFPIGAVANSEHILFPKNDIPLEMIAYFVAAASSLSLDYVARQKLGDR
jgi:hypothetical protein